MQEQRWPLFTDAVLGDGIQAAFALPVTITSVCVGALDLFRRTPGPLSDDELASGRLAADMATLPLLMMLSHLLKSEDMDDAQEEEYTQEEASQALTQMDRVEVY